MSSDRDAIRRLVVRLILRERVLLGLAVLTQAVALLFGVLIVMALGPIFSLDRPWLALTLVLGLGVGAFLAAGAPLIVGWRRSGQAIRQARLLEKLRPGLEGRAITLAERLAGPRPQESEAILNLSARRANEALRGLTDDAVHRAWPLIPRVLALGPLALAALLVWVFAPQGPVGVVRWWIEGASAADLAADGDLADAPEVARVGDLVLVYVYPAYTGLEPLEVTNSTGEAHGPPGTRVEVRVRSAEKIDAAALVAYGEAAQGTRVEAGRQISGSFTIGEDAGVWRLDLHRGTTVQSSRDFTITPEPDLPPQVLVDAPPRMRVALDEAIAIPWQARDDYGLTRVLLVLDGTEGQVLRTLTVAPEATGTLEVTPQDLGMSPGMSVTLQVGAYDNNGWSGEQLGLSPEIQISVGDPDDLATLSAQQRRELLGELVGLLAGQLVDPWPPGRTPRLVVSAGEGFDKLYGPLRDYLEKHPEVAADRFVRRLVEDVVRRGQDYVIHTQVHFDPTLSTALVDDEALARADALRQEAVASNEQAILLLDRYDQSRAFRQVLEETRTLASLGERLSREIAMGAAPQEIASALERVQRSRGLLDDGLKDMSDDGLRSMIQGRSREIGLLEKEVRGAIARGDVAEATRLGERLARQLQELKEDLEYRMKAMDEEAEQLEQQVKRLLEEMKRMEREQRQLQSEVRSMRESGDAQGAAESERLWTEVERLASQAADRGEQILEGEIRSFYVQERVRGAVSTTSRLTDAARARDLRRAQAEAEAALQDWSRVVRGIPESARVPVVSRVEQAQRLLDRLQEQAEAVDPATAAQARALRGEQSDLETALEEARQMATEVAARLPIEPRGMESALESGQNSMGRAGADLDAGRPMPAEGSQGQAAERIREARQILEETLQQMAESGGEPSSGENQEQGSEGEPVDLDEQSWMSRKIEIEEEFDLDAFQRDLLRGMQGDVPESFRSLKKRYYEELMTQ